MDGGKILKRGVGRGELQVVGGTRLKEYGEIEKDAGVEGGLEGVMVDEGR